MISKSRTGVYFTKSMFSVLKSDNIALKLGGKHLVETLRIP